jgi:hypothetical protein
MEAIHPSELVSEPDNNLRKSTRSAGYSCPAMTADVKRNEPESENRKIEYQKSSVVARLRPSVAEQKSF